MDDAIGAQLSLIRDQNYTSSDSPGLAQTRFIPTHSLGSHTHAPSFFIFLFMCACTLHKNSSVFYSMCMYMCMFKMQMKNNCEIGHYLFRCCQCLQSKMPSLLFQVWGSASVFWHRCSKVSHWSMPPTVTSTGLITPHSTHLAAKSTKHPGKYLQCLGRWTTEGMLNMSQHHSYSNLLKSSKMEGSAGMGKRMSLQTVPVEWSIFTNRGCFQEVMEGKKRERGLNNLHVAGMNIQW